MNYSSEMTDLVLWCEQVHEEIVLIAHLVDEKPQANEASQKIASLRSLYENLKSSNQPDSADHLYNHLTRAVLHLRLSYEEVARFHPERSDSYYDLAKAEWRRFNTYVHSMKLELKEA